MRASMLIRIQQFHDQRVKGQEGRKKEGRSRNMGKGRIRTGSQEEQLSTMENSAGVDREDAVEHDGVMFWNMTCRSNADERNSTICRNATCRATVPPCSWPKDLFRA